MQKYIAFVIAALAFAVNASAHPLDLPVPPAPRQAAVIILGHSGVNIAPEGLVLTTLHGIQNRVTGDVPVTFFGGRVLPARVIAYSAADDLALLRVMTRGAPLPFAPLARVEPAVGERVTAVGTPERRSGRGPFHVSSGRVLWYGPRRGPLGNIAYNAWTYWGHGGAPLFNDRGEIVAIHTSWDQRTGWRYGLRLRTVRRFVDSAQAIARMRPASIYGAQILQAVNQLEAGPKVTEREARLAAVIERVHGATVAVGRSTGVNVGPQGLVLTAFHVVRRDLGRDIEVTFADGRKFLGRVTAGSPASDLALVALRAPVGAALPYAPVAAREPGVGAPVVAVGNPEPRSGRGPFHASLGRILWYGPRRGGLGDVAYSAWTFWGHSGSPLFDENGELVSIHNSWDSRTGWRYGLRLGTLQTFLGSAGLAPRVAGVFR